jgi:hypothetical protein
LIIKVGTSDLSTGGQVSRWQKKMLARFRSYAKAADGGPLRVDGYFGNDDAAVQREYERRTRQPVDGIVSDADLASLGLARPVMFTVEGHMSSMWAGPCAVTAKVLEDEGVCRWQPVGYDNTRLPFNNKSGIDELFRLVSDTTLLPPGTPWSVAIFSQGGIVGSEFFMQHVLPDTGRLHWRLKDCRGVIAFGNPYRERDVIAEWVPDPPRRGTQGISNRRMVNTPPWWKEHSRRGDLYAENEVSDAGEDKTAIYMAVQSQWTGDPDSLLNQMMEIVHRPIPEVIAMVRAILSGAMFLGNMGPHGAYDLAPGIDWMRTRLQTAPI